MAAAGGINGCEDQVDDRGSTPYAAVGGAVRPPAGRATSPTQQQEDV